MKKAVSSRKPAKKSTAKKSKKISDFLKVDEQVWPLERDVLYRPDRYKYVRKIVKPEGCVFCAAAKAKPKLESLCVHQTRHSMILINKYPYNSGHILVLPRRHCGGLLKLTDAEFTDLNENLRLSMRALQEVYQPGGINMGLNQGAVAGAGIPDHLHYHLIPRWSGDLNFFPLIAETKVLVETLEQTHSRLLGYFRSHG